MKPYLQVALFFAITQLLGIYCGIALISGMAANPEIKEMSVIPSFIVSDPGNPLDALATSAYYIALILFGAVVMVFVARRYKGMFFFQLLELMVVFSASSVVFFAIGLSLLKLSFLNSLLFGGAAAFLLAAAKFFRNGAKNAAAIISSAGVGALFGISFSLSLNAPLGFLATIGFVILLSIYDYIAVFKTKHMIEMARELSSRQLSFAVTAKDVPARKPNEQAEAYVERAMQEGERLDLGTGDLSVPAMISVSAYTLGPNGLVYALAVAAGSTLAIYILLKFVSKQKVFLPALPPICLGGMVALLLVKLAGF